MPRRARALACLAALLLGGMFVTPLWSVRLVAPQYPEGIGMLIRLDTIVGMKEHDLNNINSLNHYIGMKAIVPDAIPELRYMPWIVATLMAFGVAVAWLGRRRLLAAWLVACALLGAAGLADFYRWGYDYGHNLDPHAIIVVPGMSYQPPILGSKQLLNFTATSLPHTGALLAGVAVLLGAYALFLSYRRAGPGRTSLGVGGAAIVAAACAAGPPAIALGIASCVECRMLITDSRFGAVALTGTGKQLDFDSVDCLLAYLRESPGLRARSLWVADAGARGVLIPTSEAAFLREGDIRPPMGSAVSYARATAPAGAMDLAALQAAATPVTSDAP
jgi:copper chaperone NosL